MIIKELSRKNLGIPCNWKVEKCPYFKDKTKLDCSRDGVKCNGNINPLKWILRTCKNKSRYSFIRHNS